MQRFASAIGCLRPLAFVVLLASIMAIGSERFFWFWTPNPAAHIELAGFYSIGTAAGVLLMRRFSVDSFWSLLLVCPVVAYVIEGVLTPILYSGGPFVPVFPAWFTFWHGLMSFAFMIFVVRRWLLSNAVLRLVLAAVGLGVAWGAWSATLRLPENVEDEEMIADAGELVVLEPDAFTVYAAVFTAILIVSHYLVGYVWPDGSVVPRLRRGLTAGEWLVIGLVVVGVVAWSFAVPWALPMFAAYAWVQIKGLRWHRLSRPSKDADRAPSLLDQLRGHVRPKALLALTAMAPAAAGTYAMLWELDPSDSTLRTLMYATIGVQAMLGFALSASALFRARRALREAATIDDMASEPKASAVLL